MYIFWVGIQDISLAFSKKRAMISISIIKRNYMAQTKKKTATRTSKKSSTQRKTGSRANTRTRKKQQGITNRERMHLIIVACLAIIAGVLLAADVAMVIV